MVPASPVKHNPLSSAAPIIKDDSEELNVESLTLENYIPQDDTSYSGSFSL